MRRGVLLGIAVGCFLVAVAMDWGVWSQRHEGGYISAGLAALALSFAWRN